MEIPDASLVAILLFEIAIASGVTYLTWGHRERVRREMVLSLLAALLLALAWQGATVLMLLSPTRSLQIFFHQLGWNVDFAATLPLLVFTLYYTGREHLVTARNLVALFVPFGLLTLGMWTPPLDTLYFSYYVLDGPAGALAVEYGPLFWVAIAYGYGILGVGVLLIVEKFVSSPAYRKPAALIVSGVFVAWVASVIQFSGLIDAVRLKPAVYVVLVVFLTWYVAIFHLDGLDVLPIARDQVLDLIEEGVVVADRAGRIIDANPAARRSLGGDDLVGRGLEACLAEHVDDPASFVSDQRISREISFDVGGETHHFELVSSPISGRDAEYGEGWVGHLLLFRDVTPIREREMELREQKRELERQNERLDQFATVISHDLRNPLTVASGFLDIARESGDEEVFGKVEDALNRMEDIIEGVLSLARQGQTVETEEVSPVDIEAVASNAWRTVETEGAVLETEGTGTVVADEARLRQALENLFRNAVEHGGSAVTVRVGRLDDAGFYVEDDGPGIPEDEREAVFDAGHTTDGTGLGLAIVRQILQAHGWEITATESPTGGARFEVRGVEFDPGRGTTAADTPA